MYSSLILPSIHLIQKYSILLLAIGSILLLAGCSDSEASQAATMRKNRSAGYITVVNNNVNVGTIEMSKGNIEIHYLFRNDGDEPVALLEGETSCMCTTAQVKGEGGTSPLIIMRGHGASASVNQVLDPGEEATLIAAYDPNAHGPSGTGEISRDVIIKTNSTKTPSVTFRFFGNVVP
jgi:hypothetical protein